MKLDLNCDLGEGESIARTRALMRAVTSANIACGGHAGDVESMRRCVQLALEHGVRIGAHPGPWSRADFGRTAVRISGEELELLLLQQVGALERIVRQEGAQLHHIKLHGALYHATDDDQRLAMAYLSAVRRWWPEIIIYARAGGRVASVGIRMKCKVWEEAFADRSYCDDGSLVPRTEAGAVIESSREVVRRAGQLASNGEIESMSGARIRLCIQTVCLHSDTPNSVSSAKAVAAALAIKKRAPRC